LRDRKDGREKNEREKAHTNIEREKRERERERELKCFLIKRLFPLKGV
jgi:hypothetical protein